MIKIVFDTNVYISAIFWGGKPREGLERARKGDFKLFISYEILDELRDKLEKDPFKLNKYEIDKIVSNLKKFVSTIHAPRRTSQVRDCKDNMVLDCALSVMARYLVTGDKDLLVLKKYQQVEIMSITDFLDKSPWK